MALAILTPRRLWQSRKESATYLTATNQTATTGPNATSQPTVGQDKVGGNYFVYQAHLAFNLDQFTTNDKIDSVSFRWDMSDSTDTKTWEITVRQSTGWTKGGDPANTNHLSSSQLGGQQRQAYWAMAGDGDDPNVLEVWTGPGGPPTNLETLITSLIADTVNNPELQLVVHSNRQVTQQAPIDKELMVGVANGCFLDVIYTPGPPLTGTVTFDLPRLEAVVTPEAPLVTQVAIVFELPVMQSTVTDNGAPLAATAELPVLDLSVITARGYDRSSLYGVVYPNSRYQGKVV